MRHSGVTRSVTGNWRDKDLRQCELLQFRILVALLLGAWLGAGVFADIAVTQNFQTIDRFLPLPNSISASLALNHTGRDQARVILRHNAGEENNWIFLNWERVEGILGGILFLLMLFGGRPQKTAMGLCLLMIAIVATQHFWLTPAITDLGRKLDDLPQKDPQIQTFWILHGIYSGLEIFKLVVGLVFGSLLVIRRKPDPNRFAREYEDLMSAGRSAKQA